MKIRFLISILFFSISNANAEIVNRIKDGDTFELLSGETVRMIGISAPEKDLMYGQNATEKLKDLINGRNVFLTKCSINSDRDRYNRLLRYVELDGIDINKKMIELGMAQCYIKYNFSKLEEYKLAEDQAKINQLGIWKLNTPSNVIEENKDSKISSPSNLSPKNIILGIIFLILILMLLYYYYK